MTSWTIVFYSFLKKQKQKTGFANLPRAKFLHHNDIQSLELNSLKKYSLVNVNSLVDLTKIIVSL